MTLRGAGHLNRRVLLLLSLAVLFAAPSRRPPTCHSPAGGSPHRSTTPEKRTKRRVVVVGGGFAGLAAVRRLRHGFDVTLVDTKEYFEFSPGMPRPYASPDYHRNLVVDLAEVCQRMGVRWLWGRALELQSNDHLKVQLGNRSSSVSIEFDYLVLAFGCQYNIPISVARSSRPPGDSLWIAMESRDADERNVVSREEEIRKEHARLADLAAQHAHVAIVGAGIIGVEFAAELRYYFPNLRITILEAKSSCCSNLPARAQGYIQKYLDKQDIKCLYNTTLHEPRNLEEVWRFFKIPPPERVYVCVGIRPGGRQILPRAAYDERGWIRVRPTLQVVASSSGKSGGTSDAAGELLLNGRLFAIGNCAGPVPGLPLFAKNSFPAEDMAGLAAKNIYRLDRNKKPKTLRWRWMGSVSAIGLGPKDGVLIGGTVHGSRPGRVLMRGRVVAWIKEVIRWSKVNECRLGLLGRLIWSGVH